MAEAWCETVVDEALIETTRDLLPPGEGEILMRVPVLSTRLKRMGSEPLTLQPKETQSNPAGLRSRLPESP